LDDTLTIDSLVAQSPLSKPTDLDEVLIGLTDSPKRISPKFFYDERGSELFNQITQLPEYYLTRSELEILESRRDAIASSVKGTECLIEYGSGSSYKVRLLLNAIQPELYVPVDISREYLQKAAKKISDAYPDLSVLPIGADYTKPFDLPDEAKGKQCTAFFPGSTIGNFEREEACRFLQSISETVGSGGKLILGVDSRNHPAILNAAYNDSKGITAEFNLNILRHLNKVLDTNFVLEQFNHVARYNEDLGRIEMYLQSNIQQSVQIGENEISFAEAELLHTENSYKYNLPDLMKVAKAANMTLKEVWTDASKLFQVVLLEVN